MLYFDDEPNYVYSTVPQQLWAMLHFPFHLGIVLFVEGQQQLMIWQGIITGLNILGNKLNDAYNDGGTNNGGLIANLVLQVVEDFFPEETAKIVANEPSFVFNLAPMRDSSDPGFISGQIDKLWDLCAYAIFSGYHIEAPSGNTELYNTDEKFKGFSKIYNLVVAYFFVSAGGFLLVLALFTYLMKWPKDRFEWLHISYRVTFGIILALIALVTTNKSRINSFVTSPWIVPMMMLILLGLLLIDKLTVLAALKYSDRKVHHHRWLHGQDTGEDQESKRTVSQRSLISTSVSSTSFSSSSSSSSSSGLPAMPSTDNPAPDSGSGSGSGGPSSSSNGFEGYPHVGSSSQDTPPRSTSRDRRSIHRSISRDYYAASQLEQVEEVPDEDVKGREGSNLQHPIMPEGADGLNVVTPSVVFSPPPSSSGNHPSRRIFNLRSPSPAAHAHIPITHRHLHSPIPTNLGKYDEFLSPGTPPLGTTYYERSLKSPITVIRHSFESSDSVVPKPLNLAARASKASSSNLSNRYPVSTDMPQTQRGFMATPMGFVEGEEGRFNIGASSPTVKQDRTKNEKGVAGIGKFMRSTESMLGVRQ
ncbi:hypothetical protein ABW20_dc0104168 [Dactylellina cionopaga]|nr:hypothetical protein ABW20_dc0104168 [Dactylellina cionopaga]